MRRGEMGSAQRVMTRLWRGIAALAVGGALAGCASVDAERAFAPVAQATRERAGLEPVWTRSDEARAAAEARTAEWLRQPLSMEAAVQVALLNNRGLQAALAELGVAEADRVQAGLLTNPGFSFGRVTRGDEIELERGLHLGLAALVTRPWRLQLEQRRLAQAQAEAANQVLALAADTRKAWVLAVAAQEALHYARQVMQAAEAGAELARRMAAVGNFNKLQQAREQAFYAEAALGVARAEQAQRSTRERLTRLMGLWGAQSDFRLPGRLPDLPATARERPEVERLAVAQRLDVQAARLSLAHTAQQLGLSRLTGFADGLELGVARNGSNEAPVQTGWEIGFRIPLFDWGQARVARAEFVYRQAAERAAETATNARSEVREAYGAYRSAWDIARHHRDELVPLKRRISEENLLRYNGMLIGVFELLADARSQIGSVNAAIEALRDFWLAEAELDRALVGRASGAVFAAPSTAGAPATEAPGGH